MTASSPLPVIGLLGLSVSLIEMVVRDFYARAADDELLGPVFAEHVKDWEPHLARMVNFWSRVLLAKGDYSGNPMAVHQQIPGLTSAHFGRWLTLFDQSVSRHCPPEQAAGWNQLARAMAKGMQARLADQWQGRP